MTTGVSESSPYVLSERPDGVCLRLPGQNRYDKIGDKLKNYQRRTRVVIPTIIALSFVIFAILFVAIPTPYTGLNLTIGQILSLLALVCLGVSARLQGTAPRLLPPVEDTVLYYLKGAHDDLEEYHRSGDEDEHKKAVEKLTKAANALGMWNVGNVRFVQEGVGKSIMDFRKNFRERFIPAVRRLDKNGVQSLFMSLTGMRNTFELGQLDANKFERWNQWLTERAGPTLEEKFPAEQPKRGKIDWIKSKSTHATFLLTAVTVSTLTYVIARYVAGISADISYLSTATVIAAFIVKGLGHQREG